jgi:flagellar biosynthesis/type III secretory pathway protein FliH
MQPWPAAAVAEQQQHTELLVELPLVNQAVQLMVPVTQATISSSLDQQQQQTQQSLMAGQNQAYAQALQYAYAPNMLTAQQLSAAGLATAGFPTYAAAAGPTPSPVQGQQQPTEQRIQ